VRQQSAHWPRDLELTARVAQLESWVDVAKLSHHRVTKGDIVAYFRQSGMGYSFVHSREGALHMALSETGEFDKRDYDRQAFLVEQRIATNSPRRVLELGCGRGYNLARLGSSLHDLELVGIDLTPSHVRAARRSLRRLPRVQVRQGDFESMPFADASFDAAFSVESLCQATDPQLALKEAARVVRPGGQLVLIDAWRRHSQDSLTPDQRRALGIVEKSMVVGNAVPIAEWISLAEQSGWRLVEREDYSVQVMPNLERFERFARGLLSRPLLASVASRIAREHLLNNVIAGYLMAQSVRQGFHFYGLLVLERVA